MRRFLVVLLAVILVALVLLASWPAAAENRLETAGIRVADAVANAIGTATASTRDVVGFALHSALYVPLGLIGVLIAGRAAWYLVFGCASLFGVIVELSQLLFASAAEAGVRDALAHAAGALIGVGIAVAGLTLFGWARADADPAEALPATGADDGSPAGYWPFDADKPPAVDVDPTTDRS